MGPGADQIVNGTPGIPGLDEGPAPVVVGHIDQKTGDFLPPSARVLPDYDDDLDGPNYGLPDDEPAKAHPGGWQEPAAPDD